jgi:outer membrane protein assembly factor BamB
MAGIDRAFTFAFFSETDFAANGFTEALKAEFSQMKPQQLAFAIHGGNITRHGTVPELEAYRDFAMGQGFPIYHLPGTQDVQSDGLGYADFESTLKTKRYGSFERFGVHVVLLDSTLPFREIGHIGHDQLKWLQGDLAKAGRSVPIFVAVHHAVGRDRVWVDNEETLLRMLAPYNVKLILCGHERRDQFWTCDGIGLTSNRPITEGSWQTVVVDPQSQVVGLFRHTRENAEPELLIAIPLAPSPRLRPLWASLESKDSPDVGTELRWDQRAWVPMKERLIPKDLDPGLHRLSFRRDERNYFLGPAVPVRSRNGIRPRWSTLLPGGSVSTPVLERGKLLVTHDAGLVALSAENGKEQWKVDSASITGSPVTTRDMVLCGTQDGKLLATLFTDGSPKWSVDLKGPLWGTAVVVGDFAIAGSGEGSVTAVRLRTGERVWSIPLPFTRNRMLTDGNYVYLVTSDGVLCALSASTGELVWRKELGIVSDPCYSGGTLYAMTTEADLLSVDTTDGSVRWRLATGLGTSAAAPVLVGGQIFLTSNGQTSAVQCRAATDGALIWQSDVEGGGVSVAGGRVAVVSASGKVSLLNMKNGECIWSYQMPTGHCLAAPLLTDSQLVVTNLGAVALSFDLSSR